MTERTYNSDAQINAPARYPRKTPVAQQPAGFFVSPTLRHGWAPRAESKLGRDATATRSQSDRGERPAKTGVNHRGAADGGGGLARRCNCTENLGPATTTSQTRGQRRLKTGLRATRLAPVLPDALSRGVRATD